MIAPRSGLSRSPWSGLLLAAIVGSAGSVACGAPGSSLQDAPQTAASYPKTPQKPPAADESEQPKPFATPKAQPPPAPEGSVLLDPPLYVQSCSAGVPCPALLQPAGETHCRELELGGREHWRLPDREEVKRMAGVAGLEALTGFHWTRSAYAEDAGQAWIVDPATGQETTIPRDRKPFTIRCVFDP